MTISKDAYEVTVPLTPGSRGWHAVEARVRQDDHLEAAALVLTPTRASLEVELTHRVVEEGGPSGLRRFSHRILLEPTLGAFWLAALLGDIPTLRECLKLVWPGEVNSNPAWFNLL
jgi:hypothetical protein